ncbi:MAG TPA: hypothetical protein VMM76_04685 [Pirellulaceae bacterium]|nr:hypothetical protein [Pirellulaceae bacterium]
MSAPQNVIAVIFDFDDTLTHDSTTKLLEAHGIDTKDFWANQVGPMIGDGWDPALAYLTLILENVGDSKPLGSLTNESLRKFGSTLEFYQGLPGLFTDLRNITRDHRLSSPKVEVFIISGGLEEVIRGSSIAQHVDGIYGCRFDTNDAGCISRIKNVISFTEKTRFIFEINKGLGLTVDSRKNPYKVNEAQPLGNRRIPLRNMIYVGDGLTDVPCFSLLEKSGGRGFGVFDRVKDGSPKQAWQKLLAPQRVSSLNAPRYREDDELGALLRAAVSAKCSDLDLATQSAL